MDDAQEAQAPRE